MLLRLRLKRSIQVHLGWTLCLFLCSASYANAALSDQLKRLQNSYPQFILKASERELLWIDGTSMPLLNGSAHKTKQEKLAHPDLFDHIYEVHYPAGLPETPSHFTPLDDPGRIRYEPFFKKMYGETQADIEAKLRPFFWLPNFFGSRYPLLVTTVNGVYEKLTAISSELETLCFQHPDYLPFLDNPGGTYSFRVIANTGRLSPHSFGMTLDINSSLSNYWQWDLEKEGRPISEEAALTYRNTIPWEIVLIFEKYGFIWGGKWQHYDTMHFEYRPELLLYNQA